MNLALFDFDGTLTKKDSLEEFIIYMVGKPRYYFKLLLFSPIYLLYKLKIVHNSKAKEMLFRLYFRNISEEKFKNGALKFSNEKLDTILRANIYKKFQEHKRNGDRVIIVSASMRCWLQPWTNKENVELLSTELEFIDSHFSGYFKTKNCHGEEKLLRVKELVNLQDYELVYAYGDSSGDKFILEAADVKIKL